MQIIQSRVCVYNTIYLSKNTAQAIHHSDKHSAKMAGEEKMWKQHDENVQVSQYQRRSSLFCPVFLLITGHAFLEAECAITYNAT